MSVRWSPFTKGVVIAGLLLLGVWLLNRFNALLGPLVTALLAAYLLNLPVSLLTRRTGMSRTLAAAIVFLSVALLLVLLPALIGPRVVAQIAALGFDLQAIEEALNHFAGEPIEFFTLRIDPQSLLDQAASALGAILSPVAASALTLVANAAEAVGWLIFVLVIAFYLIKDLHYFARLIGEWVPTSLEPDFYRLAQEFGDIWNAFLRGQIVLSLAVGLMTSIALGVVGMRSALVLGILTGVLNLIPSIGPVLAAIPAVLLALARGSSFLPISNVGFAILVLAIFIVIFQIENLYLQPVILGRRVRLHPTVVIVGAIGGALTAGVLGIFLAAPVISSFRVLMGYTFRKLLDQEPFDLPRQPPQALGVQWRGLIRGRPVEGVLFDLDGTLVETDDRAVTMLAQRLIRFQRILPGRDPLYVARRLLMWANHWVNYLLALLDRVGLDTAAQRLARRVRMIEDHTEGHELQPVADTLALLQELSRRYALGVVSTRREAEIRTYLQQHSLEEQFQVIVGFDTTQRIKPHPQPILWAAQRLAISPESLVMVGDTAADVQAAKTAGALAVGVLCGFGERRDLEHADLILESTADLAQWL